MDANKKEQEALRAAGYEYDHPGYWGKSVSGKHITIADGVSMNGYAWEVQIFEDEVCIAATEGFATVADAIAMAEREAQS